MNALPYRQTGESVCGKNVRESASIWDRSGTNQPYGFIIELE